MHIFICIYTQIYSHMYAHRASALTSTWFVCVVRYDVDAVQLNTSPSKHFYIRNRAGIVHFWDKDYGAPTQHVRQSDPGVKDDDFSIRGWKDLVPNKGGSHLELCLSVCVCVCLCACVCLCVCVSRVRMAVWRISPPCVSFYMWLSIRVSLS